MKMVAFVLLLVPAIVLADDQPVRTVQIYCSSEDLDAGFKDKIASAFCKELGNQGKKKKSLTLADGPDNAQAVVRFLGSGTFTKRGETTYVTGGYAWTPDETAHNAAAVVQLDGFSKEFTAEGIGFQATGGVADQVEEWVRENRETILEKAAAAK